MIANPYEILGVTPDMDLQEIKKKYRKLAKVYHPDAPTGNQDQFIQVQEAWEAIESGRAVYRKVIKKSFVTHVSLFKFRRT